MDRDNNDRFAAGVEFKKMYYPTLKNAFRVTAASSGSADTPPTSGFRYQQPTSSNLNSSSSTLPPNMIGALRRRADTHSSSAELRNSADRISFLGLPHPYGSLFPSPNPNDQRSVHGSMVHHQRGFMNCFFWCGQTGGPGIDEDEEDEEDLAVVLPDVSGVFMDLPVSR